MLTVKFDSQDAPGYVRQQPLKDDTSNVPYPYPYCRLLVDVGNQIRCRTWNMIYLWILLYVQSYLQLHCILLNDFEDPISCMQSYPHCSTNSCIVVLILYDMYKLVLTSELKTVLRLSQKWWSHVFLSLHDYQIYDHQNSQVALLGLLV